MKKPSLESILRSEVDLLARHRDHNMHGYYSLSDFVLKNGAPMRSPDPKLPKGIKLGKMGRCYENAGKIALFDLPQLIYCEGYSCPYFPVLHAWLLTKGGQVIDPTWQGRRGYHEVEYYGIAFKTDYLRELIIQAERWGVIDMPMHKFPVLRTPAKHWRHPIMEQLKKVNSQK